MQRLLKRSIAKSKNLKLKTLKQSRFSMANLVVFALIFAGIGGYLIYQSRAAGTGLPAGVTLRAPDGGKSYFSQFTNGAPLDDPTKIIVANWAQFQFDTTFVQKEKDAGINLEPGVSGLSSTEWSNLKAAGINALSDVRDQDALSKDPTNTTNVGWHYGDEADMTFGAGADGWNGVYQYGDTCIPPQSQGGMCGYTVMETLNRSQPDRRVRYMEYGKGVEFSGDGLSAGWETGSEAARFVNGGGSFPPPNGYQDLLSAEVYWYTDGDVNNFSQGGVYYNNGTANITLDQRRRASNYGLLVDSLRAYDALDGKRQAILGFVELGHPGSESDRAIQPAEVKAAVWHSMIAGARGIIYFPFTFGTDCQEFRILASNITHTDGSSCFATIQTAVKDVDAQLQQLAPVLNDDFADGYVTVTAPCNSCANSVKAHVTQGVRAMAKYHNGSFYVFAGNNDNASKTATFTIAGAPTGTVNVVNENRTLTITNGTFSDTFADGTTIHIYQLANNAGTPDTTPPTVSLTAPSAGSTVSGGSVTLSANASDDSAVVGVQFKIDGNNVGSEDSTSPYSITWNSATVANGSHAVTALARDAAGNTTTSSSVNVTVSNTPDTTPPTVSITAPTNGSTVSGASVAVSANASDNVGVAGVQFKLDGANLQSEDTSSPYSVTWDSTTATNGSHTLTAIARDATGNSTTATAVSVTVNNVAANLTMGETNILSGGDNGNANLLIAQSAALSQTSTTSSMSFYVSSAAGKLRLGIYDATGPGGGPGAKKAETAEITPVAGWNTASVVTPVTLNAGTYWLAYLPSDNNLAFNLDSTSGTHKYYSFTYGTMPNTFSTTPTSSAGHWSFYASLVSGAAGPKQGDINGDNSVNITDLSLLLSSYGQSTTQCVTNSAYKCDISSPGDGIVNIFDLSILLSKYGT
jgi:hypothetical protein